MFAEHWSQMFKILPRKTHIFFNTNHTHSSPFNHDHFPPNPYLLAKELTPDSRYQRGGDVIFDHRLVPVTTYSMATITGLQPRIGITAE
jgi:hypothetical protein